MFLDKRYAVPDLKAIQIETEYLKPDFTLTKSMMYDTWLRLESM